VDPKPQLTSRSAAQAPPGVTLSTTELSVLGLLAFGERSGYDLLRLAERSVGYIWTPSRSQIYKVLPRLVTAGLATAREVEQRRRPDKALYTITPQGRKTLRAWLGEIEHDPPNPSTIFALKLFFCDFVAPEVALAQLNAYRAFLTRRLDEYEQMQKDPTDEPHLFPQLVLARAIARIRATLDWADGADAAIAKRTRSTRAAPSAKPRRRA
jgi:PadR family transcriptional regulator, regulatory protein AphA